MTGRRKDGLDRIAWTAYPMVRMVRKRRDEHDAMASLHNAKKVQGRTKKLEQLSQW